MKRIFHNVDLTDRNSFHVNQSAETLVEFSSAEDLIEFFSHSRPKKASSGTSWSHGASGTACGGWKICRSYPAA